MNLRPDYFFDLTNAEHHALFDKCEYVWEALNQLGNYLQFRLQPEILGTLVGKPFIADDVFIGEGTVIEHGAFISGPAWIGKNCHIRNGAYIRGNVVVGDHCTLGNSCEFKNSILLNHVEVPHFSYVGDSILGNHTHLGSGVTLSNLRFDQSNVTVKSPDGPIDTGRRKLGGILGDHAEVGCHSVLNPGSVLGKHALVYPMTNWRGSLADGHMGMSQAVKLVTRKRGDLK